MALLAAIVTIVGLGLFIFSIRGLFKWKGRRKRALLLLAGTIVITPLAVGTLALIDDFQEQAAFEKSGFSSKAEFQVASDAGYQTKSEYDAYLVRQDEKRKQAEAAQAAKAVEQKQKEEEQRRVAAEKEAKCKQELQCWGDKNLFAAAVACDDLIERFAKYSHEWTDGMLEPKFSHFRWKDRDSGIVTFIGDKIRFQNGFGAWSNMIYECDFEPVSSMVVDVRVQQGRL